MPASAKTKFIAEQSLKKFFTEHERGVYYWTFTTHDLCSKDEAEKRFKPFKDLVARREGQMLEFWELQDRGAWHVHLVTDLYFDVNVLRPWMIERKWGPQMKVRFVKAPRKWVNGEGWVLDDRDLWRLVRYLCKYLTKCFSSAEQSQALWGKKKVFGGSSASRIGTTRFAWNPWETGKPGARFYYYGRLLFVEAYGESPSWKDLQHVLRLGYEDCGWADFDPFYRPP